MDASERLAAWLANDLDADERIALEAELARDPELRAALAAMERADRELEALTSPQPRAGFDQRLEAAIAAELTSMFAAEDAGADAQTDALPTGAPGTGVGVGVGETERTGSTRSTDVPVAGDVFASRRAARERKRAGRRSQTLIGVAAAAVLLAGSGVLLSSLGSGDDADDAGSTLQSMDTGDADDAGMEESEAADGAAGPVVVADGRVLSRDDLDALLLGGELDGVAAQDLEPEAGRGIAGSFQAELGARSAAQEGGADDDALADDAEAPSEQPTEETDDGDVAADADASGPAEDQPVAGPPLVTRDGTPLPADLGTDAARCLDELLVADPDAIPVYVEFATYEGAEVIVYGLVTADPATGRFSRTEVWVLDRATCQVLEFTQR